MQAVCSRGLMFVTQIVLAALLTKADFGLIGLALSIRSLTTFFEQAGLRTVLIQRGNRLDLWQNSAFWLSVIMGLAGMLVTVAAAPIAGHFFGRPELVPLILVLALMPVINSIDTVGRSRLMVQLRFRTLAIIGVTQVLIASAASVIMALMDYGPYAFIVPMPLGFAFRTLATFIAARPRIRLKLRLRRCRYLIGGSVVLIATSLLNSFEGYVAVLVLGTYCGDAVVGLFFFSMQIVSQSTRLLLNSIAGVLLPVFSQLNQSPERQAQAFLRVVRVQSAVVVPLSLLVAVLSGPLLRTIFGDQWTDAIPILSILTVAMSIEIISSSATVLLDSHRRYGTRLGFQAASLIVYSAAVSIATLFGDAVAVATGCLAWSVIMPPIRMYIALKPFNGTVKQVVGLYARLLPGYLPMLPGWLLVHSLPSDRPVFDIGLLVLLPPILLSACFFTLRVTSRPTYDELVSRAMGIFARFQSTT